jgi:hypothetical protein
MILLLDTVKVTGTKHVVADIHHQTGTIDVVMKKGKFKGQTLTCECSSADFAKGARIWVGMVVKA